MRVLFVVGGYTYVRVGEVMVIPLGTVILIYPPAGMVVLSQRLKQYVTPVAAGS